MPDDTPLEAPTALKGLHDYPAIIIGTLVAGLTALVFILGAGNLDDGFQWNPDGYAILSPMVTALAIRTQVFTQSTVDRLAPRSEQAAAVRAGKKK